MLPSMSTTANCNDFTSTSVEMLTVKVESGATDETITVVPAIGGNGGRGGDSSTRAEHGGAFVDKALDKRSEETCFPHSTKTVQR